MMQKFFFILLIAFSAICLKAQTNIDSLWGAWNDKTQSDTDRLEALYQFNWNGYLFSQPDSAFHYAQMQYDFAKRKGVKKQMASALNIQGISFALRGDYSTGLEYYQGSLKIMEEIGDKKGAANILNNIGIIYNELGNNLKALEYHQRSLKIKEELGDMVGIGTSLGNIGNIYKDLGDNVKALEYYDRGLIILEEIGDKRGITNLLGNIGSIYEIQDDNPKALEYNKRSLKIFEEIGDKTGFANTLHSIGLIYYQLGDNRKALESFERSLKISEEIGDKNALAICLNSLGDFYHQKGEHQQAIEEYQKSLRLAQEIGSIDYQRLACNDLYSAYKAAGNGNKALEYHEMMVVLNDSLNAEEIAKELQQMEFAKQVLADSLTTAEETRVVEDAHQEEVRQKNRTRNMLAGGGLLLLVLAGGIYSRLRYIRKAKAIIEKEKDRSDSLLLNILPAEIAEELKEKGEAAARDFDMVSILFTDFKGFTEASEKLSATDLVAEINVCFKAFDGIVGKYNIEKIKTIGDAYMAAGGLPVPDENAAKNTVNAALEMQVFIAKRKEERDALGEPAFEMRAGIHTGSVVAGIVGVKKFQYDIWGDTVNTASRMESSGEVGQVNISQATYELVKADPGFSFSSRGKVLAKGKGEMEMWFVEPKG